MCHLFITILGNLLLRVFLSKLVCRNLIVEFNFMISLSVEYTIICCFDHYLSTLSHAVHIDSMTD